MATQISENRPLPSSRVQSIQLATHQTMTSPTVPARIPKMLTSSRFLSLNRYPVPTWLTTEQT